MNWVKKFLSNLFSFNKPEKPADLHIEQNNQTIKKHELNTRIIYQYPKGEFRFPLIKDTAPDQRERRQPEQRREQSRGEYDVTSERPVHKKHQKIEPKNRQPFEPTHIPSPIYGFRRPVDRKRKSSELGIREGMEGKNQTLAADAASENVSFQREDIQGETQIKTPFETEPAMVRDCDTVQNNHMMESPNYAGDIPFHSSAGSAVKTADQEGSDEPFENAAHPFHEEEKNLDRWGIKEKNTVLPGDNFHKEPEISQQITGDEVNDVLTAGVEIAPDEQPIPVKQKVQDEESTENDNGERFLDQTELTNTQEEPKMDMSDTFEGEVSFEEKAKDQINEQKAGEETSEIFGRGWEETEKQTPSHTQDNKTASPVSAKKAVDQEKDIAAKEELEDTETNVDQQGSNEKQRSHLPFNVLMLSQDRIRWQRQKERELQKKSQEDLSYKAAAEEEAAVTAEAQDYSFPPLQLLMPPVKKEKNTEWLNEQTMLLNETMENFNVKARVVNASQGPSVTRFEVQPDKGVKVNKITNLSNDIKLSMAARDIRMEAPIPGTRSIGIELPNKESRPVQISEIIGNESFLEADSPLTAALGLDISGTPIVTDLRKMPHGLIAGATGSGKSVCINSILVSLLYKARPDELKLMLIDPKMVELAPYNHIPHLVSPVITDVKAATAALKWAVDEMERRYELFVHAGVRDISRFNQMAKNKGQGSEHLPYIVIVIDELADLMMVAPAEVEESICRIAQKARACGIHLLIATQRPSVDVITGLIKANVPTRIAFAVSSQVDSRTVIDVSGAEKLLGRGDMLFLNNGSVKPVRLQGTFVSDDEIDRVIEHVRSQAKPNYLFQEEELLKKAEIQEHEDELLLDACEFVVKQGNASTSLLQRHFRIGYNRAARLMEMMEDQGVISGAKGSKPRDVLINESDLDLLKESLVQ
ncbi:DNA translocase FtsK [Siminovitchia sediminis]|uniref:DNA translocase FtsK n=1 Tax=Siminovitchia sediminis TaxID=1274353 RepID=A0ABW4KFL4_9BACI